MANELEPAIVPRSRWRVRVGIALPLLLIAAWYGGKAVVRWHVDGLIHGKVGVALQPFRRRDRLGVEWSPARLRGRPAVLHFFRSRCESCEREAPEYRALEQQVPASRAAILHFATDAVLEFPAEETAATIARKAYTRPVLIADKAFVDAFHSVAWSNVTPVTYVVDAQGNIRSALRGAQTASGIEAALAAIE